MERTIIFISEIAELHERSAAMWNGIAAFGRPVFQIDGAPVRIKNTEAGAKIEPLAVDGLRHEVSQACQCQKVLHDRDGNVKYLEIAPPLAEVKDALASAAIPLPPIKGIITHPVITDAGAIIGKPGYNAETGLWLDCADNFLTGPGGIPAAPGRADLAQAVNLIGEVVIDFPFKSPADRAGYFALLLTMLCRPLIKGVVPMFFIKAPTPGTGKSKLAETAIKIITGKNAVPTSWSDNEDEMRKSLYSLVLGGGEYVFFDNITTRIKSGTLAALITSGAMRDRVLGFSKTVTATFGGVIIGTGNNPDISREIARRCILIELETDLENPASRSGWRHPDLDSWITENRPALVRAALVMARAWFCNEQDTAGVPTLGSFEAWAKTIGGILKTAGVEGFLGNTAEALASDSYDESWIEFVTAWVNEKGQFPVVARDLLPIAERCGLVDGARSESYRTKSLGRTMGRKRDMVFNGIKVSKCPMLHGYTTWTARKI